MHDLKTSLLGSVLDGIASGLILLDGDRRVVSWNQWLSNASDISHDHALGKTLEALFPDRNLARVSAAIGTTLRSGTSNLVTHSLHPWLFPLRTRAGRPLFHDVMISALDDGPSRYCLVQIHDVTVATERERVLRDRQNARYDAVVDSAPDVILTLDSEGAIRLANPAAVHQFGYEARELIGQRADFLFDDRDTWAARHRSVMSGATLSQPAEIVARRKDGTRSHLEISLSRWMSDSRLFTTAILRDVNERYAAENALRASEAQFRSLAQAMPNHVWTSTSNGALDWFNDRVYEYSGALSGDLDGNAWVSLVHPDDIEAASERWASAVSSATSYETQFRLMRADGVFRWHIARAFPIKDAAGNVTRWVGSNTDIDDQKSAAQALKDINATLEDRVSQRTEQLMKAEEALRQSHKMEALGQLTGGIAHDFNNLLQGIIGALDRIQKRVAEGRIGDIDRFLNGALDSATRAAALTHRLLAFSRRQPVDPRAVDVNQLISSVEELLRRSIGENIEMSICGFEDLWLVRCDGNQLENALLNLAINARDAMPDGGKLTIETSNRFFDSAESRLRELDPGQYVCLRVKDTGVGMSPEVVSRAFDPFYTTKPIGKGTGLGLSMIYGFVRQSDGSVRIDSASGNGTTVEICLPRLLDGVVERAIASPASNSQKTLDNEIVLVVEDEAAVRLLIVDVLGELGYHALEAADGTTALKILQSGQRVDLLISDIGLPGLNGRQVADGARVSRPGLRVLFMTGYAENAAGKFFLEDGMEIITKPFAMDVLASKIREMIASK